MDNNLRSFGRPTGNMSATGAEGSAIISPPKSVIVPVSRTGINGKVFAGARHSIARKLVTYQRSGSVADSMTTAQIVDSYVETPSSRLRLSLSVAIELTNDTKNVGDPAFSSGRQPTLTVYSMSKNPDNGTLSVLRQVYPTAGTTTVPDGYEADTAAPIVRVSVGNIQGGPLVKAFIGAYNAGVEKYAQMTLIASWEPNVTMPDDEVKELFRQCKLYGPNTMRNASGASTYGVDTTFTIQLSTDT